MKKLILGPLLILGIPQVLVSLFFLFVRAVLGWNRDTGMAYVVVTGIAAALSIVTILVFLFGVDNPGAISEYEDEQRRLAAQREMLQRKLEEEIGIPRIK